MWSVASSTLSLRWTTISFRGCVHDVSPEETLNKLIPLLPFDFAQESVRQAHHERNKSALP